MQRPQGLPDYSNPPLVEVVLGLQFDQLEDFASIHYKPLFDLFSNVFGNWEEKHPLPPSFEVPNIIAPQKLKIQADEYVLPRLWLMTADRERLIQVQSDRFIVNWRSYEGDGIYPRYETIRNSFLEYLSKFAAFLNDERLGTLRPNQAELTYVNHLKLDDSKDVWQRPSDFLKPIKEDAWNDPTATVEFVEYKIRHSLLDEDGFWRARMHTHMQPIMTQESKKALSLNLSVKGEPKLRTIDSSIDFMNWARLKIVEHFTALTTEQMHEAWGRKQ